jgi:hypothetical protein
VSENGVLNKTSAPKRKERYEKRRKLHNEQLYDYFSSPNFFFSLAQHSNAGQSRLIL